MGVQANQHRGPNVRPNTDRTEKINLGFTRHETIDYVETPPQCFKCQRYGHLAKYCRGDQRPARRDRGANGRSIGMSLASVGRRQRRDERHRCDTYDTSEGEFQRYLRLSEDTVR
ncbi:hypothetical protein HPB49_010432 [Dermacentor silvarum]|uniref:Uncharacterized protein n=1 Tax=Dermacentor silvarum TaxID=543639 RepID=A0ACB8CEP6_DERSI|nr:hypothetical protein HPB49_010432 [Dermacentor silvarum]